PCDHRRKQRRRAIQHPGQRRRDSLLGEGKHAERKGEPEDSEHGRPQAIFTRDWPPRRGNQRQCRETDREAGEGDAVRRHHVETFGDEQKRGAPNHARDDEDDPIDQGVWHPSTMARDQSLAQVKYTYVFSLEGLICWIWIGCSPFAPSP